MGWNRLGPNPLSNLLIDMASASDSASSIAEISAPSSPEHSIVPTGLPSFRLATEEEKKETQGIHGYIENIFFGPKLGRTAIVNKGKMVKLRYGSVTRQKNPEYEKHKYNISQIPSAHLSSRNINKLTGKEKRFWESKNDFYNDERYVAFSKNGSQYYTKIPVFDHNRLPAIYEGSTGDYAIFTNSMFTNNDYDNNEENPDVLFTIYTPNETAYVFKYMFDDFIDRYRMRLRTSPTLSDMDTYLDLATSLNSVYKGINEDLIRMSLEPTRKSLIATEISHLVRGGKRRVTRHRRITRRRKQLTKRRR